MGKFTVDWDDLEHHGGVEKFDPDQPRDEQGRWAGEGAGASLSRDERERVAERLGPDARDRERELSFEAFNAVEDYRVSNLMNGWLRGAYEPLDERERQKLEQRSAALQALISTSQLAADVTLYRGIGTAHVGGDLLRTPGTVLEDPGFSSWTYDRTEALRFGRPRDDQSADSVVLRMRGQKGDHALHVSAYESEVLYGRGERFRVVGVERDVQLHPDVVRDVVTVERVGDEHIAKAAVRIVIEKLWDPDQPRDEQGRWGDGSEGGNASALRAGRAPVQGADSSALELPGWSPDRSLTSANGQQTDPRTGKPIPGPDTMMGEIARAQGYDGPPRVVSAEVMDRLVAQNKLELFRGLGGPEAEQHATALREGELFAGRGALGSGIYTASATEAVPDPHAKASEYATRTGGRGAVVRMTLHPDARIADHDEMRRDMVRDRAAAERRGASPAHLAAQYQDVGRYAALRGYDVVRHEGTGYHVVLNRTALIVQRENVMAKADPDAACITSCPAHLSQLIGPWFATRTVADLPAAAADALTRAVLGARRWTDLSLGHRALLLRAAAEFEEAPVALGFRAAAADVSKSWQEASDALEEHGASQGELDEMDLGFEQIGRQLERDYDAALVDAYAERVAQLDAE